MTAQARNKTNPGFVAFYTSDGERRSVVQVGALPDAVTFTPDGGYRLVANEGEPDDDYVFNPEGSVSIIDVTVPMQTVLVQYLNTRDFSISEDISADLTGTDLGPEGLCFVPSEHSPDVLGRPLLLVGHEVSGTTVVYAVEVLKKTNSD